MIYFVTLAFALTSITLADTLQEKRELEGLLRKLKENV